jgi:8-oxo-dGTP diphosphatase
MKKVIEVVAAIIEDDQGQILIARRKAEKSLGGYWEFPGGKIDGDESFEQAIEREILEELDFKIQAKEFIGSSSHAYEFGTVNLHGIRCHFSKDEHKPESSTDHDMIRWIGVEEMKEIQMAPADIPLIKLL